MTKTNEMIHEELTHIIAEAINKYASEAENNENPLITIVLSCLSSLTTSLLASEAAWSHETKLEILDKIYNTIKKDLTNANTDA